MHIAPPSQTLFRISHPLMMTFFPVGRKSTTRTLLAASGSYVFLYLPPNPLGEFVFRRSWARWLASSLLLQLAWVLASACHTTAAATVPLAAAASPRAPIPRLSHRRTPMTPAHLSRTRGCTRASMGLHTHLSARSHLTAIVHSVRRFLSRLRFISGPDGGLRAV